MTKEEIRAEARARLAGLSPEEWPAASERAARWVWTVPEIAAAGTLLLFAALPAELDTDPIARAARERGVRVVYPRCLPASRAMTLHEVREPDGLRRGSYGIREPGEGCERVEVGEIDAALVPGLGWDRLGGRLGRGAGYYDRLFADPGWRGFRCGLLLAAQRFDRIPMEPWDARLHAVATDAGAERFAG